MQEYSLHHIFNYWEQQLPKFLKNYQGIAVACSGGADSTALFHHLALYSKQRMSLRLAIAHVNYSLRGAESDQDQYFLEKLAQDNHIPCFVQQASLEAPQNVQIWARMIRYKHFEQLAKKGWLVAIAHTENDVGENILLRMCRGSSPGSLLGMQEWRPPYWRPFLNIPKASLLAWLAHYKLPYREDSTNSELKYTRNIIRMQIIPELEKIFPGALRRITRCAEQTRDMAQYVRTSIKLEQSIETNSKTKQQSLPINYFSQFNQGVALSLLADFIKDYSPKQTAPQHRVLKIILDKVLEKNNKPWQIQLAEQLFCRIEQGKIYLDPKKDRTAAKMN